MREKDLKDLWTAYVGLASFSMLVAVQLVINPDIAAIDGSDEFKISILNQLSEEDLQQVKEIINNGILNKDAHPIGE